jgi:hypothetical protein
MEANKICYSSKAVAKVIIFKIINKKISCFFKILFIFVIFENFKSNNSVLKTGSVINFLINKNLNASEKTIL